MNGPRTGLWVNTGLNIELFAVNFLVHSFSAGWTCRLIWLADHYHDRRWKFSIKDVEEEEEEVIVS